MTFAFYLHNGKDVHYSKKLWQGDVTDWSLKAVSGSLSEGTRILTWLAMEMLLDDW